MEEQAPTQEQLETIETQPEGAPANFDAEAGDEA